MRSALITIGDEILIGQVTDTNAVWISQQLNTLGVEVGEMVSISDDPVQITETLDRYMGRYDLLIMTGGLGPTKDDLTKQTLAEYYQTPLVTHRETYEKIAERFRDRGWMMTESNIRQAEVPEGCTVLNNNHGTAPGMWFDKNGTILVSLPGVPYEMKGLMEEEVLPRIGERVEVPNILHRTIMTQGVPESFLAEMIRKWEEALPACMKLAYLPRPGIVRLRLTVRGKCADNGRKMLEEEETKLLKIIPQHVFGFDDISLEQALEDVLKEKGLTVATAESCTGGNIARLLTSVPGSSACYQGSVIAYQNSVKTSILKVESGVINSEGAVSGAVVEQMARGVMGHLGSDTAIATSGIAGPDGGTVDKPVGTTWIAVAYGEKVYSNNYRFIGTRDRIITQASYTGMQLLRRLILGNL